MPLPRSQLKPPRKSLIFRLHPAAGAALALAALCALLVFGLIGLSVAREESFRGYAWVPRLLVIACGGLILTTLARIFRRRLSRNFRRPSV